MHFELEQEGQKRSMEEAEEAAPMETDAESSSKAGISALLATQARVSEGCTLMAPSPLFPSASEGDTLMATASEGRSYCAAAE